MTKKTLLFVVPAAAALLAGCHSGTECIQLSSHSGGTTLATVGSDVVTSDDLSKTLEMMPPFYRMRFQNPEARKQFVKQLAENDLFAQEALREGLQNDPDVQTNIRRALAQKLLQKVETSAPEPSAEKMQAFYDQHKAEYQRPERVQLFDIFLAAPKAQASAVKKAQRQAQELEQKLKAAGPKVVATFQELVTRDSQDPRTKPLGGDMHALTQDELKAQYGEAVVAAAEKLKTPNEISAPVQTDQGFYLLRLQGRTPAMNMTFDQVKPQIRAQLQQQEHGQQIQQYISDLKAKSNFKIDDQAIANMKLDLPPPPTMPGMPGMMPHPAMPMPPGHMTRTASGTP